MNDIPGMLGPPGNVSAVAAAGGVIGVGTYNLQVTALNQWGETTASAPVAVTLTAGNQSFNVGAFFNIGTISARVYVVPANATPGMFAGYFNWTVVPYGQQSIILSNAGPTFVFPGNVPTRNSAFLPDSDGRFASAYTLYRWLNSALNTAAYVCKGIPDTSGLQMVQGQGFFTMPGIWEKLENMWFDGYPLAADARGGMFYRNVLTGISFIIALQTNSDRQIIEIQPQPDRTGGVTTLSAPAGISDSQLSLTSTAPIGLSLGMVQVGTEICSYGTIGATGFGTGLSGVARGLGGTQQQAWPIGTTVTELNFRFGGLRLNQQTQYIPGQSGVTLQVPPGWRPALVDYMIGKYREGERRGPEAKEYLSKFTSFLKDYVRGTKQTAGPRQLGSVTPAGDGYPSASSGGRIIVP